MRRNNELTISFIALMLIIQLVASSCLQQGGGQGRRGLAATSEGGSSAKEDPREPEFPSASDAYWFSGGIEINGNLLLNENTQQAIYLRGKSVHNFLRQNQNFDKIYCLVITYNENNSSAKRHLRARALPISFNNFSQGTIERLLRVDIAQANDNQPICSGEAYALAALENTPSSNSTIVGTSQAAFSPPGVCSNCSGIISSTNVSLYKTSNAISSSGLEIRPENWISLDQVDLRGLGVRIDVQSNVVDEQDGCTNSACQAKGFDCCLSGQCAKDGAERPNATEHNQYFSAKSDVQQNPANFINYPEIFYVCPNIVRPAPGDPDPIPDPEEEAQRLFQRNYEDFLCLQEGKKDQPEFEALGLPRCGDLDEFIEVRSQVWKRCGCQAEPFPGEPDEPACPDFGLRAILNAQGQVERVVCDVPDLDVDPVPFQALDVRVPNRTAPHRFFDEDGRAWDNLEELRLMLPQPVVEGEPFSYLDESGKTEPIDTPFSMNAILGQFNVTLNRAIPAKVIYVEFDQTYVIAARSGFYTPCPMCAKDNWFSAFSAFPSSQRGTGLIAQGYSTSRDTYSGNNTNGNYEDTIFGRACWVPPTMLPFSHRAQSDLNAQRRSRLETQAALFANGYQRDWFGFNKGALIASFDGVKWFAVGKGRRVQSTSQRLFLAINAPFADLTENTDTIVEVVAEQTSADSVAEMDYDTELPINHPEQNTAASCQYYHQCNTDSDCISNLGWEYACADINQFRTKWPKFDINGNEIPGEEYDLANFTTFLQGPFPQDNGRRCVYRGAGAPCKRDYSNNLDPKYRKQFTCAPNFYCASLGDNTFNDRVVRTPNQVDFILFGQGSRVLGRPLHYIGAMANLTDTIRTNIEHNASSISNLASDFGICRPGRSLASTNPVEQHRSTDNQRRTDFINQIGSCTSNALGLERTMSCPAIETRPGQPTPVGDLIRTNTIQDQVQRSIQNMCGGESKQLMNTGLFESTFKGIEAGPLNTLTDLLNPSMVMDACLRRAGSVCHTDLDCSPNKLHAEQAQFFGLNAFGGTSAEQRFWTEELVCSQAKPKPFLISEEYFDYDLTLNRCCREVGKEITMYTSTNSAPLIPDLGSENLTLNTGFLATDDPRQPGRYSRYSIVDIGTTDRPAPRVQSGQTPLVNQWKTINETGTLNCCGGGFIRKFADGTNNWATPNRFNLPPENFACLNFSNPQVAGYIGAGNQNNYNRDYDRLCRAPADGGCIQQGIPQAEGFELRPPRDFSTSTGSISTSPLEPPSGGVLRQTLGPLVHYQPVPYQNPVPMTTTQGPFNFMANPVFLAGTSFYLPLYITGRDAITRVSIQYFFEQSSPVIREIIPFGGPAANCPGGWQNPMASLDLSGPGAEDGTYCLADDITGTYEIMHVLADEDRQNASGDPWIYAGVIIEFIPPGSTDHSITFGTTEGMLAGNDLYYLTKLSRLELLGIPQIFYEPIYCNTDREQLVPGIFIPQNRTEFESAPGHQYTGTRLNLMRMYDEQQSQVPSQDANNPNEWLTMQDRIQAPAIFSGHEFKCCQQLGNIVTSQQDCCSGYAIDQGSGLECRLPSGTNLNVYFNRFVSSEGTGEDLPLGGLTEDDFIPETGEPKLRNATLEKISQLGLLYCEEQEVRFGAGTGFFYGEPFSGFYQQNGSLEESRIYSIVDSNFDVDPFNDSGYVRYLEGFRWSNNLYCD